MDGWFEAGGSEPDFWASTPRNIKAFIDAYQRRLDREHDGRKWLAWHIEAFARQKRLMGLRELFGLDEEPMDAEEIDAMMSVWMARHNSRLPPEEREFIAVVPD